MNVFAFLRRAFLFTAMAAGAMAAPRELSASASGPGEVERGGRSADIGVARINLKPDGFFSLNLIGDDIINFNGSWRELDRNTVHLEVTSAWGRDASAQGRVELQREHGGWGIESIKIAGTQRRETIKARFYAANREDQVVPRPDPGERPLPARPVPTVNSTRAGSGWYHMAGRKPYRLTHAHVQMYESGRVFINVYGNVNFGYVGRWRPAGNGTARVEVRGGLENERITGTVALAGRSFSNVALSGTVDRNFYKVEFDAR
jgi:hypothetical protein